MERIIFFDGLCPFCHFWVQYILKKDQNNKFLFAPLQGKIANELLPSVFLSVDTIVLLEDKKIVVEMIREEMLEAAENLEFEKAALIRDQISELRKNLQ